MILLFYLQVHYLEFPCLDWRLKICMQQFFVNYVSWSEADGGRQEAGTRASSRTDEWFSYFTGWRVIFEFWDKIFPLITDLYGNKWWGQHSRATVTTGDWGLGVRLVAAAPQRCYQFNHSICADYQVTSAARVKSARRSWERGVRTVCGPDRGSGWLLATANKVTRPTPATRRIML